MPRSRELERRRRARFERVVAQAIDEVYDQIEARRRAGALADPLATRFRKALNDTAVLVEDEPDERQRAENERADELLGLYEGVPLTERMHGEPLLPDRITIFRKAIERGWISPGQQREQIRKTILHEIGHALGLSEERLDDLGLGGE